MAKEHGIRKVLTGNIPGTAGFQGRRSLRACVGSLTGAPDLVEIRHERVRVGVRILEDFCASHPS